MRVKAAFVLGGAVGYVLGTRAGREQFEKIRSSARTLWENPRVQGTVSDVEQRAAGFVRDVAPELKDKVSGAVRSAASAVRPSHDEPVDTLSWGSSTAEYPSSNGTTPTL
ncbi:MAG TPA: YtxH domain-containing protein [Actinotalea sp.]|jgi:hypothetical protein